MYSWRSSVLDAQKRVNYRDVEGGSAEDGGCPKSSDDLKEIHELKGLDVLNWPKDSPALPCKLWSQEVREGKISELVSSYHPEKVMDLTKNALLHLAVRHSHCDVVRWLVEMLKVKHSTAFFEDDDLIYSRKDCSSKTALHLANIGKQIQNSNLLQEEASIQSCKTEVNAKTNGGFTALEMSDDLPGEGNIDMETERFLRRGTDEEQKPDNNNHEVHDIELGKQRHQLPQQTLRSENTAPSKYHGLLLTATILATVTFHAALRAPSGISEIRSLSEPNNTYPVEKQYTEINNLFILFNSMAFFTSLALITILTNELPIKPWLLIVLFSTIGAYMCLIMAVSPHQVISVFFIGSSILLAAFFKCLALDKTLLDFLQWIYTKN